MKIEDKLIMAVVVIILLISLNFDRIVTMIDNSFTSELEQWLEDDFDSTSDEWSGDTTNQSDDW